MYRNVVFTESGKLMQNKKVKNINAGKHLLKINESYVFNERPFYVMNGKGDIEMSLLPTHKPTFSKIILENLDYYLQNGEHSSIDYSEQEQIESFMSILEINNTYNEVKLYTDEFNNLEIALYGLESSHKVKRF